MSDEDKEPPLSEQTRRPADTALLQQRVKAWYPYLDPWWVIIGFAVLGAIFVPVGYYITAESDSVFEEKIQYDAYDMSGGDCRINTTANAGKRCELEIRLTRDLEPPILIHYEIENFHQNHRAYQQSRDDYQLYGKTEQTPIMAKKCDPLNKIGRISLNPCGFIANTLFNDDIKLESVKSYNGQVVEGITMNEEGIAWKSDMDYVFNQPDGFKKEICPADTTPQSCCNSTDDYWSCDEAVEYKDGNLYRYHYPKDNETQYLHETYGNIISPIDGVMNEHFIVWMRIAALPTFRKLYGWINEPLATGTILTFSIVNNWEVESFKGKKSLIVSKSNIFGGKNNYMGTFYFGVGWFCIAVALFFAVKQSIYPRKVADPKYLRYKED